MARITPIHLIPVLIAAASHGGEITIEQRPFVIEKTFTATILPVGDCQLVTLAPTVWENFTILQIAAHGAKVSQGEILVKFDPEAIDHQLEDSRKALAATAITLAQAERELKLLQETAPHRLETAQRAAAIAKEENAYFTNVRRKAAEGTASQSLKRSEQILANQREELKQLTKMYEADDVTEDTEEIILIRQQDAVAAAEFALSMEVLEHKRTLEVSLPREGKTLADDERDTAILALAAEQEIPTAIDLKKIAFDALTIQHSRMENALTEHEQDRTLFQLKAPAAGTFYHGPIENGTWTTGDLVKGLTLQKAAPLHRAFATFVPADAPAKLVAFVDQGTQRVLEVDATGCAILAGREDLEIPVRVGKVAAIPTTDSTYQVELLATWPKDSQPVIGSTAKIRIISHQQATTLAVPTRALTFGPDGWTVEVKLADGKTERRLVKRGLSSKDETEILSGLDVGQVVVVP